MTQAVHRLPPSRVFIRKLLLRVGFWYFVLCLVLFAFQRKLIFHPDKLSTTVFATKAQGLVGFREVLEPFQAIVLEPRNLVKGTAVLFHGNAGTSLNREMYARELLSRGFRLVLAEYPGYGTREGSPSEDVIVADAKELYLALRTKYPSGSFLVMGESLGSGVAVRVAAESNFAPDRLVLFTPFASLREVAGRKTAILPTRWMVQDAFLSTEHIGKYPGPVSFLIADQDEVVGASSGKTLRDVAKGRGPVEEVLVSNAGHNDWFFRTSSNNWDVLLGQSVATLPTDATKAESLSK